MPVPTNLRDEHIPPTIYFNQMSINGNKASVNLDQYYVNSVELVKHEDKWYITGFSTHPTSKEVKDVTEIVKKHLNDIKYKNRDEAVKPWIAKEDSEFRASQRKIVDELIKNADKLTFEIGEIELWSLSDPHRAESPDRSTHAKVKILIREGNNTVKYKLILSREYKMQFAIDSWNTDPLSISQLY
jgi:hypothetical protein